MPVTARKVKNSTDACAGKSPSEAVVVTETKPEQSGAGIYDLPTKRRGRPPGVKETKPRNTQKRLKENEAQLARLVQDRARFDAIREIERAKVLQEILSREHVENATRASDTNDASQAALRLALGRAGARVDPVAVAAFLETAKGGKRADEHAAAAAAGAAMNAAAAATHAANTAKAVKDGSEAVADAVANHGVDTIDALTNHGKDTIKALANHTAATAAAVAAAAPAPKLPAYRDTYEAGMKHPTELTRAGKPRTMGNDKISPEVRAIMNRDGLGSTAAFYKWHDEQAGPSVAPMTPTATSKKSATSAVDTPFATPKGKIADLEEFSTPGTAVKTKAETTEKKGFFTTAVGKLADLAKGASTMSDAMGDISPGTPEAVPKKMTQKGKGLSRKKGLPGHVKSQLNDIMDLAESGRSGRDQARDFLDEMKFVPRDKRSEIYDFIDGLSGVDSSAE